MGGSPVPESPVKGVGGGPHLRLRGGGEEEAEAGGGLRVGEGFAEAGGGLKTRAVIKRRVPRYRVAAGSGLGGAVPVTRRMRPLSGSSSSARSRSSSGAAILGRLSKWRREAEVGGA